MIRHPPPATRHLPLATPQFLMPFPTNRSLFLVHKLILALAFGAGLWLSGLRDWAAAGWVLGGWTVLTVLAWLAGGRKRAFSGRLAAAGDYALDLALVLYLIGASGGYVSPYWPLLVLQVVLPAFYLPWSLPVWVGMFASGPLYVLVLWRQTGTLAFLTDALFLARYLMLFVSTLAGALAADHLRQSDQRLRALERTLATREADLDAQAKRMQRTAADLGDRVLQLRSIQEVARALAATLDLPDTLQVLVDRLAVLFQARYAAIALIDNDSDVLRGAAVSGSEASSFHAFELDLANRPADLHLLASGALLAESAALSEAVLSEAKDAKDRLGFGQLRKMWQMDDLLCLPLALRGRPLGAIYLAGIRSDQDGAEQQRQLLDSFAYFAAAAVENGRLYQAVADKSRELEAILSGIGDGVVVVDGNLHLVLINPVAAHIFGLEAAPPAGLPVQMFIDDAGFLELLDAVKLPPYQAQAHDLERKRLTTAGAAIYQALSAPLVEGDDLKGIATVLRDVTSQKELERMKSNFLSVVSHELKTPLHSIKGFVDIILMGKTGPVTEIQRDFLETVKQQTDHLQRMIDDLLEFSRLESGRVTLRLQPLDVSVVIEAVVDKLTPLADSAEVTLVNQTPETLASLSADPWRLEQVITNLVDNAIKFTPPQGRVTISAADDGDFVQINVADTGIGIPPGEGERVFDRFYQIDSGANRLYKGTGLGLTICRHIVEHHGGRIWVKSEYGKGAVFSFTLSRSLQSSEVGALDFTTLPQARGG